MTKNNLLFFVLVLFFLSCKEKKEIELKLLFKTYFTDNDGNGSFNTKIGISDSVFHIQEINMAHIGGYVPVDTTNLLWIKGKEFKTILTFNKIKKKYNTSSIYLNKIIQNDSLNNLKYKTENKLKKQQIKNGFKESFAKINGDYFVQLIDTGSKTIFLKIKNKSFVKEIKLKNYSEIDGSIIKSFDITNDGNNELFILSPGVSYWGRSWKVDIYQLENLK